MNVTEETVWKVPDNHVALPYCGYHHTDCPHEILFRSRERCVDAMEEWLRRKAAEDQIRVCWTPEVGPEDSYRFRKEMHGDPHWQWRAHTLEITREPDRLCFVATYDVRTLVKRMVLGYAEVDGQRVPAGRVEALVPVVEWRPYRRESDTCLCDGYTEHHWAVIPTEAVLRWGDADSEAMG